MSTSDDASEPDRRAVGERGERLAADYIRELGWSIREQNFETPRGEVDIIAHTTDELGPRTIELLAFVEVKTHSQPGAVLPESAVTRDKRETLTYMARRYVDDCDLERVSSRFDVVTVVLEPAPPDVEHYPAAFDAEGRLN